MSLFLPAAAGFRPGLRGSVSSAGSILVRGAPFPAFSGALSVPSGRTARPGGAGPGLDAAAVRRSASPASVRFGAAPARRIPADRVGSLPVCLEPRRRGDGLVRQSTPAFAADRRGAGGSCSACSASSGGFTCRGRPAIPFSSFITTGGNMRSITGGSRSPPISARSTGWSAAAHWNGAVNLLMSAAIRLVPAPETIFLLNSVMIFSAVPLVYLLGRRLKLPVATALVFALFFLFSPVVSNQPLSLFYGFHPVNLLPALFLLFFLFRERRQYAAAGAVMLLTLFVQETRRHLLVRLRTLSRRWKAVPQSGPARGRNAPVLLSHDQIRHPGSGKNAGRHIYADVPFLPAGEHAGRGAAFPRCCAPPRSGGRSLLRTTSLSS